MKLNRRAAWAAEWLICIGFFGGIAGLLSLLVLFTLWVNDEQQCSQEFGGYEDERFPR